MAFRTEMYRFSTTRFTVVATIEPDTDLDLSWDDTGETTDKLQSGEWQAFGTRVRVLMDGREIGEDSLWGSIYADPASFFADHRAADPMQRNCSMMRAARGDGVCIGHYFPDMIRTAVAEARATLCKAPRLRCA